MTDIEIKVAIAEACGGAPYARTHDDLPDYPNDLNAMHVAEKQLLTASAYERQLTKIVSRDCHLPTDLKVWLWHATARQRAEAFLKTIDKWRRVPSMNSINSPESKGTELPCKD